VDQKWFIQQFVQDLSGTFLLIVSFITDMQKKMQFYRGK